MADGRRERLSEVRALTPLSLLGRRQTSLLLNLWFFLLKLLLLA
jgi:hypothetical protein